MYFFGTFLPPSIVYFNKSSGAFWEGHKVDHSELNSLSQNSSWNWLWMQQLNLPKIENVPSVPQTERTNRDDSSGFQIALIRLFRFVLISSLNFKLMSLWIPFLKALSTKSKPKTISFVDKRLDLRLKLTEHSRFWQLKLMLSSEEVSKSIHVQTYQCRVIKLRLWLSDCKPPNFEHRSVSIRWCV